MRSRAAHPACEQRALKNGLNPNIGAGDLLRALGLGAGAAFAVKAPLESAESAYPLKLHSAVHSVGLPTRSYDPFLPDRCAG